MTIKNLVLGVASVAVVGAAAAGITAVSAVPAAGPQVQPVAFGTPLPATPAPDLQGPLLQTLNGLTGPGSFSGPKGSYIQGGLGRLAGTADRKYNQYASQGYFPLSFTIANIDQNGGLATANVSVTAANGVTASQPLTFVAGPSPSGWQVEKGSAMSFLSSL
ncbi:hypothetical protein LV457_14115 [Mycobacterium sp. MYCO198283]|uniref:hypothetical protein n=1 Tax=Mycobacterium sp. MYCO198283 TaxID=2883505 RepID=UPI001E4E91EB|nr:hypothetical protein [Mycobacterium sp. MYCO198283]MCG5433414.1 hypothetical protein [Mycobacterium sp. MYCO198283]